MTKIDSEYSLAASGDELAQHLAQRIRSYWSARGRKVETRFVRENGYLQVRSNMIGGLPPR